MSSEDEYEEEDLDALLENDSFMDESSMSSQVDLDLLLARPSESQLLVEDDLNKRDLMIRDLEEVSLKAEKEVKEEIEELEKKHSEVPRQIGLFPPGLVYFSGEGFSVFSWDDLTLEKDFGYTGRGRLEKSGLSVELVDKILSDRMTLVRYLTPEVPQNNIIATQEDFVAICDFIFYSLSVCPIRFVKKVMEKALFDLFKSYGYDWKLTNTHLFVCWINFGASEKAILQENFYKNYLGSRSPEREETFVPAFPSFFEKRRGDHFSVMSVPRSNSVKRENSKNEPVTDPSKLESIKTTFHIISQILRHSSRFSHDGCKDRTELVIAFYLVLTAAQDQQIIKDVFVAQSIKEIFHCLLDRLDGTEEGLLDVAEFLIWFFPGNVCPGTVTWDYDNLPKHFQNLSLPPSKRLGYNHPHNMLHCLLILPSSHRGEKLRCLLAYIYLQMTLGIADLDLPFDADMTDVHQKLLVENFVLWRALHCHHYAMRCVVGFLDVIFSGDASDIPHGGEKFEAVRQVNGHLSEYGKRLPSMDPLNLDPVVVKEITCELSNRWTLALQNSENVFTLKEQTTAYMAKAEIE